MKPEHDHQHRGLGCALALVILFLLPIVYVLATGPIVMLYQGRDVPDWLEAIYAPLGWLMEESPLIGTMLRNYMNLWLPDE